MLIRPRVLAMTAFGAMAIASRAVAGQQPLMTVSGTVRDSANGQPLAGALVEFRMSSDRRTTRTDEAGLFRIARLSPGRYQLSVMRIGFSELRRPIALGTADTTLTLAMRPVAQRLGASRVRGDTTAIYGVVAAYPDLRPLSGTLIQVLGDNAKRTTDSAGGFFIPVSHAGRYLVRMSHDGFVDRIFTVEVPNDRAVEASRMLDPGPGTPKAMNGLYVDADKRLQFRGMNSAVISGTELRKVGGSLSTALQFSPTLSTKGLRGAGGGCIFVNGVHRPYADINMWDPDEIEAIEVYGLNGEKTGDLAPQCIGPHLMNSMRGIAPAPRANVAGNNAIAYYVIWLRK